MLDKVKLHSVLDKLSSAAVSHPKEWDMLIKHLDSCDKEIQGLREDLKITEREYRAAVEEAAFWEDQRSNF